MAPGTGGPDRHSCWLATIDADGSPHVNGIGALWLDGAFWFETGEHTRKGRNLARDPRCTLSLATHEFDLVVEGTAELVKDPPVVAELAARWAAEGWPCRGRRVRHGPHRRVQRPVRRPAAVARLPAHPAPGAPRSAPSSPAAPPAGPSTSRQRGPGLGRSMATTGAARWCRSGPRAGRTMATTGACLGAVGVVPVGLVAGWPFVGLVCAADFWRLILRL